MAEKTIITFLGTGGAVPTRSRNHPSVLINYKDENLLFDCGEGTQRQFRIAGLNPCKITRLFITHWHGDHVFGIPGLLQTLSLNGYNKKLYVYGPRGTENYFDLYRRIYLSNGNKIDIEIVEVLQGIVFENEEIKVVAAQMDHDSPCLAYSFLVKEKVRLDKDKIKKLNLPNSPLIAELLLGKKVRIGEKVVDGKKLIYKEDKKKITYITDTRINPNAISISEDSDVLISEPVVSDIGG